LKKDTAKFRKAFTILEILISVIIISFSIIYVLKIHSTNQKQIVYLSERNKQSLEDSLFLTANILKYHKEKKSADIILEDAIKIKSSEGREILKKLERNIFIAEEILITPPPHKAGPTAILTEIKIKGNHSSNYKHLKISKF
jgi:competence protein ComGC